MSSLTDCSNGNDVLSSADSVADRVNERSKQEAVAIECSGKAVPEKPSHPAQTSTSTVASESIASSTTLEEKTPGDTTTTSVTSESIALSLTSESSSTTEASSAASTTNAENETTNDTTMADAATKLVPKISSIPKSVENTKGDRIFGDLVWARMKGFSWWPSRITEPNPDIKPPAAARHKKHHFCYFFGSDNYAWVEEEKMADYDGNREKLKPAKISANLQAAIDKIEEALVEWKLRRKSDICASATFDEGADSPPTQQLFDFTDDDSDEDADIFSSNIMSNRNGNIAHSPRLSWRGEDSSGGSDGEFSLGFSSMKRKAPTNNNNEAAHDASKEDAIDSPVKTKRARKAPSKLADYAVGDASSTTVLSKNASNSAHIKSRDGSVPAPKTQQRTNSRKSASAASSDTASATPATHKSLPISKMQETSKPSTKDVNRVDSSTSASTASSSASPTKLRLSPSSLRFGFIGLGAMGSALASCLLKAGHKVTVWNRTIAKCKDLVKDGANKASSAAEVVSSSDVTYSCVSDPSALKEVVFGNSGALQGIAEGKGYVDMSTVDVETCLEVAEAITSRGGRFLEAPLCGSKEAAKFGCLSVLAAGDKSLYDDCQSCFNAIAKKTFYLGDVGNAAKMKSVTNLMDGVMMAGLAEALALTEQVGLRHQDVMEVLELGSLDCELIRDKGREMMEGTFTPSVALKHQQKDLKLAVNMADEHHLPLVTASAANELFKRARAMGYDEHDNSAVYRAAQYNS